MKYIPYIFFFIFTISCEQKELPISPHQIGDVLVQQIEMLQDYRYQVFYNLENNEIMYSTDASGFYSISFDVREVIT